MNEKLTNRLLAISGALQNQKYMCAIKNAFTNLLPIIIVGSFCTLFSNVLCSTKAGAISLANIAAFKWMASFAVVFNTINYATMNLFALFAAVMISYELCEYYKYKEKIICSSIALASYVSLCATSLSVSTKSGEAVQVADVLSKTYTGVQGLFLAMIVSIVATELYVHVSRVEKLKMALSQQIVYFCG